MTYKSKEECMITFSFSLDLTFSLSDFVHYFQLINEFPSYGSRIVLGAKNAKMIKA